ncbi:MAG: hypothetical protein ACTSU0_07185 [Alphaproteobacteria bacterium]
MNLTDISQRVTQELTDAISTDLPERELEAISEIVRGGLRDASHLTHEEIKETAVMTVGSDASNARKLREEIDLKRDALINNLSSMR